MVSMPLPTFEAPFSSPLEAKITSDGTSTTAEGKMTIFQGVKVDGVAGGTATIGGVSSKVKVKKGKASFEVGVDLLQQSYTFKNGEKLSLSASVDVELPLNFTIKLTGSDTKSNVLKFDKFAFDLLPKIKTTLEGTVTLREDPDFKNAGILVPPFTKFKKWTQKIKIAIAVTFEASKTGDKTKKASVTRTLEWALRPLFQTAEEDEDPDDDPDENPGENPGENPEENEPPRRFSPPDEEFDWESIPTREADADLLSYVDDDDLSQIIDNLPENLSTELLEDISTSTSEIQQEILSVLKDVNQSQEEVSQLSSETKMASEELESAETELETAEAEIETVEGEITAAEEVLAGAETAETTAAAEVTAAAAAETAADVSEAADWWTIFGAIASAAAIVAATAALTAAITKHNHAVKTRKEARVSVNRKKKTLGEKQLTKKQAIVKVQHQKEALTVKQKQLKEAKEKEKDAQNVKHVLKAAHVGIEKIAKMIKNKKTTQL